MGAETPFKISVNSNDFLRLFESFCSGQMTQKDMGNHCSYKKEFLSPPPLLQVRYEQENLKKIECPKLAING